MDDNLRKYLAEFLGTAAIVAAVVGAGHMVTSLGADQTVGLAVIAVTVAAVLFVVINLLMPISGAQFNPIVTLAFGLRKEISAAVGFFYIVSQFLGAVSGAVLANLMFDHQAVVSGVVQRMSAHTFIGEIVASAGLVLIVLVLVDHNKLGLIGVSVACWIAAGHIFTSSTSFANPAVTFGRSFTDAVTGIELGSVAGFMIAQLIGAGLALGLSLALKQKKEQNV